MHLFELDDGEIFHETEFKYLYHMTDHHGFAFTINQDSLRGLRQNTVSTTYDPRKNSVFGYQGYDFKFVLNARPLIEKYGAFNYDFHTTEIRNDGSRKSISLDENEIRINTRAISPFRPFLLGTVLLFDLFSQRGIQWFLYDNNATENFFGEKKSAAPRAIEALYKHVVEWKRPIWLGNMARKPNAKEFAYLQDVFSLHCSGKDFHQGMLELCDKYVIKDHWDKVIDRKTVERRALSDEICNELNSYYQNRPYNTVNLKYVENLISRIIDTIDLGNNAKAVVMQKIRQSGILHQVTAPISWGIIIKELMNGDIDEALEAIDWVVHECRHHIQRYNTDPSAYDCTRHVGTQF